MTGQQQSCRPPVWRPTTGCAKSSAAGRGAGRVSPRAASPSVWRAVPGCWRAWGRGAWASGCSLVRHEARRRDWLPPPRQHRRHRHVRPALRTGPWQPRVVVRTSFGRVFEVRRRRQPSPRLPAMPAVVIRRCWRARVQVVRGYNGRTDACIEPSSSTRTQVRRRRQPDRATRASTCCVAGAPGLSGLTRQRSAARGCSPATSRRTRSAPWASPAQRNFPPVPVAACRRAERRGR
jgi:hypothetical protein